MLRAQIARTFGRTAGSVAGAIVMAFAISVGCTSCVGASQARANKYCAILADSVGLYAGNPVAQMGIQVGTVEAITPSPTGVRVDFTVTDSRRMPKDVTAVIRSTSILADRTLELVGNYESGPQLESGECVPRSRTATPKSLSEVIGSANKFVSGISPKSSSNIGDVIDHLDRAAQGNGPGVNEILTTSSRLLDNPDAPIGDLGSIVDNLAVVTRTLVQLRDPLKQILNDAVITTPYVRDFLIASANFIQPLGGLVRMLADIETHAGDELQVTLDAVADVLRINTPHMPGWVDALGGILKPLPWWINTAANHFNNREFHMSYRPPLYRIRTPNAPLVCGIMNASTPGSCANVAGQPYGVDINLLQYVFMNANH